jgi:hypothetical protein
MTSTELLKKALFLGIVFLFAWPLHAQTKLPKVKLRQTNGQIKDASTINGAGKPLLLVFWKLSDHRSCENLERINDVLADSLLKDKIKFIAICIGDEGQTELIKPFTIANNIQAEVYIDVNGDLRRSMGIQPPHILLYDHEMKIHCQQKGYCSGNEELICNAMRACLDSIEK